MSERYAPEGKVWLCMMCGKTTKDCYGEERGWDESCAINCILVDEATKRPTEEQAHEFSEDRRRRIDDGFRRMQEFRDSLQDGTWKPDPELLALAEEYLDRPAPSSTQQGEGR